MGPLLSVIFNYISVSDLRQGDSYHVECIVSWVNSCMIGKKACLYYLENRKYKPTIRGDSGMIDFTKITTYPIKERQNKFRLRDMIPLDHAIDHQDSNIESVARAVVACKAAGNAVIVMLGGAKRPIAPP